MSYSVNITGFNGTIDKHPAECPRCHSLVHAQPIHGSSHNSLQSAEITYLCPNHACNRFFIAGFRKNVRSGWFEFMMVLPTDVHARNFAAEVKSISPDFCSIYNEAYAAEQYGLAQVCGVGYRKSLEFLVKDYLIKFKPECEDKIKAKFLGRCIDEDIDDAKIKAVAKRATWLGNDETHYVRKWQDKDVTDLKALIELTVYWITSEQLTQQALISMPE